MRTAAHEHSMILNLALGKNMNANMTIRPFQKAEIRKVESRNRKIGEEKTEKGDFDPFPKPIISTNKR